MLEESSEKFGGFERSITEHRKRLSAAKPLARCADVLRQDLLIPIRKDVRLPIQIYKPKTESKNFATIFFVPGTAFVASEVSFTRVICSHLAEKSGSQVVILSHRLAPEDQFPKGLDDSYNLFRTIVEAPKPLFGIDKNRIAIVGYSSGGNFSASMAVRAHQEKLPFSRLILISPLVDLSRSLKDFKDKFENKDTVISDFFVDWFLDLYLPEGVNPKHPWLSPFWQKNYRLKGLPPTDIIFAEYDRFRSDSQAYYNKLTSAGVSTSAFMVQGEDHSFLWYKLEIVEEIGAGIRRAFGLDSIPKNPNNHLIFVKPRTTQQADLCSKESFQKFRSKL